MKDKETPIPPAKCPECGYFVEVTSAAYNYGGRKPSPGDVSMCLGCGHLSIFNKDLTRREPTDEEVLIMGNLPEVLKAQQAREQVVGDKIKNRKSNGP